MAEAIQHHRYLSNWWFDRNYSRCSLNQPTEEAESTYSNFEAIFHPNFQRITELVFEQPGNITEKQGQWKQLRRAVKVTTESGWHSEISSRQAKLHAIDGWLLSAVLHLADQRPTQW